jgi:hypothetical protein
MRTHSPMLVNTVNTGEHFSGLGPSKKNKLAHTGSVFIGVHRCSPEGGPNSRGRSEAGGRPS